MIIVRAAVLAIIINFMNGEPVDYKALIDNLRLEYYNHDYYSPNSSFKLFKYNRTQFAINASFWILHDVDGRKIKSATKLYAFLSNSFKFTGLQLKIPSVCKMWQDDLYGIRRIMTKCGDVDLCDIKKGPWVLTNCWPIDSIKYYPKSVPQGSYKVTMESEMNDGTPLVRLAWYGKASLYFSEMKRGKGISYF